MPGANGWSIFFAFISTKWPITDVSMASAALVPTSTSWLARLKMALELWRSTFTLMPPCFCSKAALSLICRDRGRLKAAK